MMRRMVRSNPYRELATFERAMAESRNGGRVWRPALDVIDNDEAFVIRAALPGLKAEEITINVEDDVLTLKAEREETHADGDETYLLRERRYGSLRRSVRLPSGVNADGATAEVEDGILTLTLPKREEYKPKQIAVKVK